MSWILKFKFDLPFLDRYVNSARGFLTVTKAQACARIVRENDGAENRDIVSGLLKAKDSKTGRHLTATELVSEATLLLIADK